MDRLLVAFTLLCIGGAYAQFQVTSLPLLNQPLPSAQYTGYINVNETYERDIFYWFVESENDPATDPVLLWLQGGPGCAGTWGMWVEHGPFKMDPMEMQVNVNPHRWTRNASMIYIDQPAGVGFSYTDSWKGIHTNDFQAATDNYIFLQKWYELFPQYSSNDLWITGESYGGVYVPMLVDKIVTGNDTSLINSLKGFQVGNPVIRCRPTEGEVTAKTLNIDNYFYHGLISYASRQEWYNKGCQNQGLVEGIECLGLFEKLIRSAGDIDGDDLYTNECTGNGTINFFEANPGCTTLTDKLLWYFNQPDVRASLNVSSHTLIWDSCAAIDFLAYGKTDTDMLNYYNYFFNNTNLRILVYSGDVDIHTVPHPGTQMCLAQLGRPTVQSWAPWMVTGPELAFKRNSDIIAGYVEVYDTYSYATVRAAGHEVPLYQPAFGFEMFYRFIIQGNNDLSTS